MTTLALLIELGRQHEQALERARCQIHPDVRLEHRRIAGRELQDAVAGHLLPLSDIVHVLHSLGGMLGRHADHSATADAESELIAADELLSEAITGIDTAIEHEQAAEWAQEEQRAAFTAGLGVGFPVAAE